MNQQHRQIEQPPISTYGTFSPYPQKTEYTPKERKKWVTTFGEKILHPDQTINRIELGKRVFENRDELIVLNNLVRHDHDSST